MEISGNYQTLDIETSSDQPSDGSLVLIPLFVAAAMRSSMLEVQKRDKVEDQDQEEGHNERDAAQPREHEGAVAGARGWRGNPDNVVESSQYLSEEFDHGGLQVA